MIIRPVDLQVLIPKASEINRVNHVQEIQSQLQQQQFTAELAQALHNRPKQVQGTMQKENQRMRLDKDSRGQGGNRGQADPEQKQQGKAEEDHKFINPQLGHHIDIKT